MESNGTWKRICIVVITPVAYLGFLREGGGDNFKGAPKVSMGRQIY